MERKGLIPNHWSSLIIVCDLNELCQGYILVWDGDDGTREQGTLITLQSSHFLMIVITKLKKYKKVGLIQS